MRGWATATALAITVRRSNGVTGSAERARLELIEGEQIVDLQPEAVDIAAGIGQQLRFIGAQMISRARLEQTEPGPDGRQRRLQVVGDRGDEVAAQALQLGELLRLELRSVSWSASTALAARLSVGAQDDASR